MTSELQYSTKMGINMVDMDELQVVFLHRNEPNPVFNKTKTAVLLFTFLAAQIFEKYFDEIFLPGTAEKRACGIVLLTLDNFSAHIAFVCLVWRLPRPIMSLSLACPLTLPTSYSLWMSGSWRQSSPTTINPSPYGR